MPHCRIVFVSVLLAALTAQAEPYFAHPELTLEGVVAQQASFLISRSQGEIARRYVANPGERAEIRARARTAFGGERPVSDASLEAWLAFTATRPAVQQGAPTLAHAWRWIHAVHRDVVPVALSPRWKERAEALCAGRPGSSVSLKVQAAVAAWKLGMRPGGERCEALVADVLDIVYPHANPMRPSHLEAFSPALLRLDDSVGFLDEGLRALSGVERLNPDVDVVTALSQVLPGWSPQRILRLLGAASHNHAFELEALERILARTEDEQTAVREATAMLGRLNHLYALIGARPYHHYGAALVACELVERGHAPWVVSLTGAVLGEVYETATSHDGRPDAGDVQLHRDGTRYGLALCTKRGG